MSGGAVLQRQQEKVDPQEGGANGASIVTSYCESRGWQRIYDKTRKDFILKWCETKSPDTYNNFKEGEQLLYQIPNNKVLTSKTGLLSSLREYDRVSSKVFLKFNFYLTAPFVYRRLRMEDFFPTTFRMDVRDEREAFFDMSMWICKPAGLNQGRGIFLVRSQKDISTFRLKLQNISESHCNRKLPLRLPQACIIQQYVKNPLLLKGRKFDIRSYLLIACTSPYMVFFRHGYVRLTCDLYDYNSQNLSSHLTNQYLQKKNPLYSMLKEETVWSMDRLNTYVNDKLRFDKGLSRDWVLSTFTKQMQHIMIQCFFAVKAKLDRKLGNFDLIGCDFLIDEDFKVWLLEMNCNPALHTNCEVLKEVIPSTVVETLDLTLEIFNKCRRGLKLLPLASQRNFVLLYDGETTPIPALSQKTKIAGPLRAQHPKSASIQKHLTTSRTQKTIVAVSEEKSLNGNTDYPDATKALSETPTYTETTQTPTANPPAPVTMHNIPFFQVAINRHTVPAGDPRPQHTRKPSPRPPKPAHTRVELRLSKCTWEQYPRNLKHWKTPSLLQMKTTLVSLSNPGQTEGSCLTVQRTPVSKSWTPDHIQPFCYSLRPTQFRMAQPGTSCPLGTGRQKEGRLKGDGAHEPGKDTQSTAKEKREKEHRENM
uniref:Tubulin tyrosine ligase-like family, member 10 n=2 Tax=Esox lucius TaxID=8010 RepID=A0AAY5KL19_ESOLU